MDERALNSRVERILDKQRLKDAKKAGAQKAKQEVQQAKQEVSSMMQQGQQGQQAQRKATNLHLPDISNIIGAKTGDMQMGM